MLVVGDPCEEQDAVNLRTLQASATSVLEQATAAADMAVGNAVANQTNILNRDIRTKSLNLGPQGIATKNFSMGGQYHVAGLPDPKLEHEAVNLRTLNQKVLGEIGVNNLLEAQKYLRLDSQNQMVSDLQMNYHKIVRLADAAAPADGVNKITLDHCHFTGKYRDAAHRKCNALFRKPKFVPVFFHNLSGCDAHLFVKNLNSMGERNIDCIPNTE